MKKLLITGCLACFLINPSATAQIELNLFIAYPAQTYLSDWNKSSAGVLTVIYAVPTGSTRMVKIRTQLLNSEGAVIASSNNASARVYPIGPGGNSFTLDKVLQLDNLQFIDSRIATNIQKSGRLPAGDYQLWVQLLNSDNDSFFSKKPVTKSFVQVNYQLPFLLAPEDKALLDPNTAQSIIAFRWSSMIPQSKERVLYRLQVFEVWVGQQPLQALRGNQPILDTEIRNTTQYFWRPQINFKDSTNHVFIWTIQTVDERGEPIVSADANNHGWSEPRIFEVGNRMFAVDEQTGEGISVEREQ